VEKKMNPEYFPRYLWPLAGSKEQSDSDSARGNGFKGKEGRFR